MIFSKLPSVRSLIGLLGASSMVTVIGLLGAIGPAQAASNFGTIGNYHSGKCLDDTGFRNVNDTWMEIYTCNYQTNQLWGEIYGRSDGAVEIEVDHSRIVGVPMCLDMLGGSSANGTHVVIYRCNPEHSDDAELWYPVPTNIAGWYNFVNVASRTCMTVSGDSQSSGAKVIGWNCATASSDHSYFWEPHF